MNWMDRSYMDDLKAEALDAKRHAQRTMPSHTLECRCIECCREEAAGEEA